MKIRHSVLVVICWFGVFMTTSQEEEEEPSYSQLLGSHLMGCSHLRPFLMLRYLDLQAFRPSPLKPTNQQHDRSGYAAQKAATTRTFGHHLLLAQYSLIKKKINTCVIWTGECSLCLVGALFALNQKRSIIASKTIYTLVALLYYDTMPKCQHF